MSKISRLMTTTICTSLLFLICCHEALHVEGRHLKSGPSSRHSENMVMRTTSPSTNDVHRNASAGHGSVQADHDQPRKLENVTGNFRPTTPGHSPGVGHSIKN
ncbi:PREDICTED: LR48_Vigan06g034600 [Prunus dulcis]|uniref:PREDICTED: LR48_Vigan06g034600 n=1 Tax=Prunus dulcis TaxID=3755 RepID=A0A5E4GJ91_PRUDU|nr:Hypothetical predicted protein [Prunus dulcis]VVA39927.1 PREDICTED: LR48_Vigan06g034600 [Prunus dulcis]